MYFRKIVENLLKNKSKNEIDDIIKFFSPMKDRCRKFRLYASKQKNFDLDSVKKAIKIQSNIKNHISLVYDINYVRYSHNCSIDEAKRIIADYKANKATSKKNFISKHGENQGLIKFEMFQKTSAQSSINTKEKLKKQGISWKQYNRNRSKRCYEYYLINNVTTSKDEAIQLASQYQLQTSGIHKEYYEKLGMSESEIVEIINEINCRKKHHTRNRKYLKQKYGDKWLDHYQKSSNKYRKRMEELGLWMPLDLLSEWKKYHSLCWFYTRQHTDSVKHIEKRSRKWHLDHKFSIKKGFLLEVDPKIIGSIYNLHIIPQFDNCSKGDKCSISLKELTQKYENQKNHKDRK